MARDVLADPAVTDIEAQRNLIRSMRNPKLYGASCRAVQTIETHISYVILTGRHAYKIKKAVDLGFLDFTTLAARRFYCGRELQLNRRFAPAIYLDVVAITGTTEAPQLCGDGPPIEYALRMREFPQDALLSDILARGALTPAHVDALAASVAAFHASTDRDRPDPRAGSPDAIRELAIGNFTDMEPLVERDADCRAVAALRRWTEEAVAARAGVFAARQRAGFVRDCHGDLHLRNIALIDGTVTLFDCIEFNDAMRWSDVMADVAFLVMDLRDRRRADFASRFLNGYLSLTGDHDGLRVLRFYVVYRAMVRAKVALLRASQAGAPAVREAALADCREYLALARRSAESETAGLVITRGPAGSGKTTRARMLAERLHAIHIRTDVERKRMHGLAPDANSGSPVGAGLYSAADTDRTYSRLAQIARTAAAAGYPAIVDGTFLRRAQRDMFRALAAELAVPLVIVDFVAAAGTLRARVEARRRTGADASEATVEVLEDQLRTAEPLAPDEQPLVVTIDAEAPVEEARDPDVWQPVLDRLHLHADPPGARAGWKSDPPAGQVTGAT